MSSPTETRLETHRRARDLSGRNGPLLTVSQLSPDELRLINRDFFGRCARGLPESRGIAGIYSAYAETLGEWGVMCPHPQDCRLYDGWRRSDSPLRFEDARWFGCGACRAAVINK